MSRAMSVLRSLPGRIAMAALGLFGVALLVHRASGSSVLAALRGAAVYFPIVVVLEGCMLACEAAGLYLLYGEDRRKLAPADLARAAVVAYPMMVLLPVGRAAAEAMRAGLLTQKTSGPRAAAAAARMQGVLLLANATVSAMCALAALLLLGPSVLPGAIAINTVVVLVLGLSVLYGGRRVGLGAWLGRLSRHVGRSGTQFDEYLREGPAIPVRSVLWAFASRLLQLGQYMVLLVAVGGQFGILRALCTQGIHLVGSAMGDLIPGQLGVTEATYSLWSHTLSLDAAAALAIALLSHLGQASWATIGSIAALVWPAPPAPAAVSPHDVSPAP